MSRYLILMLLVVAVWWMIRGERRAAIRRRQEAASPKQPAPQIERETMVACARCQLHLPVSEAVASRALDEGGQPQRWFCGELHRIAFERATAQAESDARR